MIVWTEQFNQKFQIKKHFDRITAVKWNVIEQSSSSYLITTSQEKVEITYTHTCAMHTVHPSENVVLLQIIVWDAAIQRAVQTIYAPGEITDVCWTSHDAFAVLSQLPTASNLLTYQINYEYQTITLKHTFDNAVGVFPCFLNVFFFFFNE